MTTFHMIAITLYVNFVITLSQSIALSYVSYFPSIISELGNEGVGHPKNITVKIEKLANSSTTNI